MADPTADGNDFGAILAAFQSKKLRTAFNVGDRIQGTVTATDPTSVFVSVGARCEAIIDRNELLDAEGTLTVKVGDPLEAFCVGVRDGAVRLTTKVTGNVMDASLEEAYRNGIPIEGRVAGERKGGYEIQLTGQTAFCPYSQMDLFRKEPAAFIGEHFAFLITEYEDNGRSLVLSRRALLERERAKLKEQLQATLKIGEVVEGTVTRLMPYGVFVDLGGAEGLVHISELGWGHVAKPEDVLSQGERVKVMVREIDWEKDRISLSLKQAQGDPWSKLDTDPKYHVGARLEGTVRQLAPFGAFVELEPGIEGLVHVSKLGTGGRVKHPEEILKSGDRVEVSIDSIDHERRRIGLSMDDTLGKDIAPDAAAEPALAPVAAVAPDETPAPAATVSVPEEPIVGPGSQLTGTVEGIREFGVFVKLPNGQTGLLHISEVQLRGSSNKRRALYDTFKPGSTVEVVVREIDGRRISLTVPETLDREAQETDLKDMKDKGGEGLGSLGDLFGKIQLPPG